MPIQTPTSITDIKNLMATSPALKSLPAQELQTLMNTVDQLPSEKQAEVISALRTEQEELKKIQEDFDQKQKELFQKYVADMKASEQKMAREIMQTMEQSNQKQEAQIMDQLLAQLEKL